VVENFLFGPGQFFLPAAQVLNNAVHAAELFLHLLVVAPALLTEPGPQVQGHLKKQAVGPLAVPGHKLVIVELKEDPVLAVLLLLPVSLLSLLIFR
jgi:hypothetical protein